MEEVLRVPQEEIETCEEDCFFEATYKGKPFTGIAWSDEDGEYAEISYADGTAQGRCFTLFASGALSSEEWVEQGRIVKSNAWWLPGNVLWRRHGPGLTQYYYRDGTLGIERTAEHERQFYESGVLRQEQVFQQDGILYRYYGKDGKKAAEWRRIQEGLRWKGVDFIFQDAYIRAHYLELLEDRDFERCFQEWLKKPLEGPKVKRSWFSKKEEVHKMNQDGAQMICRLICSENLGIQYFGVTLAGVYRVMEAEGLLKKALSVEVCPPAVRRLDGMGMSYGRTVAEAAKRALALLGVKE